MQVIKQGSGEQHVSNTVADVHVRLMTSWMFCAEGTGSNGGACGIKGGAAACGMHSHHYVSSILHAKLCCCQQHCYLFSPILLYTLLHSQFLQCSPACWPWPAVAGQQELSNVAGQQELPRSCHEGPAPGTEGKIV